MHNKIHKRDSLRIDPPETSSGRADWRCLIALTCLLAPAPGALAAIPAEWKNTAYAYEAQHKPLREVLEDFAQTFGTQLQIEGLLEGNVNGKIRANTPQSLLDRLGVEHRFQWYLYNNTLHISTLDQQESARLEVSSETIADLKQALTDIACSTVVSAGANCRRTVSSWSPAPGAISNRSSSSAASAVHRTKSRAC